MPFRRPHPMDRSGSAVRLLERHRRAFLRWAQNRRMPLALLKRLTWTSFRLENLAVTEADVESAISPGAPRGAAPLRSIKTLRLRNHLAILRRIERLVHQGRELKAEVVLRWYTSIACGLSIGPMDEPRLRRLETALSRMSNPQLRLRQAVNEAAALHAELLRDPLFPGFNGVLARLLLQYHLARSQLPPVVFDPLADRPLLGVETALASRLLQGIAETCDWVLGAA